jgi:hypothetical protein
MRMSAYVITAVLAAGLPAAARAQSSTQPPAAVPAASPSEDYGAIQSHWIVSGFVGSNFGGASTNASVNFGGQVAYLWKGVLGAEGIADFAPSFKLDNPALNQNPHANGYMGNAIAALPLGDEGQFQPYVSGGVGIIQMKTEVFNAFLPHASGTFPTGTSAGDESAFGSNVGGGVMGFVGMIGFRADVRYYKANTTSTVNTASPAGQFTEALLSGLNYWRANIGVALRW